MKDIKFRAWDTENKQMLDVQELNFENCIYGGAMDIKTTMYGDYFDYREMPLMQYTGLKDENGKEIYEGDIVYIASEDENAFILWDKETARYIIQFKGWCADFDNFYGKDLEVVGNIYDNPDLLEKGAEK